MAKYKMVNYKIRQYIERDIIPIYDKFDKGHDRNHVINVINSGLELSSNPLLEKYNINKDMVYVICAYHDIGLIVDRENHGLESAKMLLLDNFIKKYFNSNELKIMAEAIEDHRSECIGKRRSIYGKILGDADMDGAFDPVRSIERMWEYRIKHRPRYSDKEKFDDMMSHIGVLYAPGGKSSTPELNLPSQIKKIEYMRKTLEDPNEVQKILIKLGYISSPIYEKVSKFMCLKINNSKGSSIKNGKWKDPSDKVNMKLSEFKKLTYSMNEIHDFINPLQRFVKQHSLVESLDIYQEAIDCMNDTKIDNDEILAEAIASYTILECAYTIKLINPSEKQVSDMIRHNSK